MWTLRSWARRIVSRRLQLPEIPIALEGLAERGFSPHLIFDVGAYRGDFARDALRVWPSARVACFEPLEKAAEQIEALRTSHPGIDLHRGVLGSEFRQEVEFNMAETASSVLREHHAIHPVSKVTQWTIDSAVHDWYAGKAPDLLKLDVQGFELHVLKGGTGSLPRIGAILAEVNLLDIHQGAPLLDEIVGWLAAHGFVAYDICGVTRRPLDGALWQIDMLFVPRNSALRGDKRWGQ